LSAQGREALAEMIRDVQNGHINFSAILLYDVSRWGRFQDADESAYYEFICRRAGVSVHYCGEQFEGEAKPDKADELATMSKTNALLSKYRTELMKRS
jgi:DNA invertase Pin-like site-specific DNA recombinase